MGDDENIKGAIRNSMSQLVLFNKKAITSNAIQSEMRIADEFNKKIIIFKEKDVKKAELPIGFVNRNYEKFDIRKPKYLLNRVSEIAWRKNPNTIEKIHTYYEEAKNYQILTSQLTGKRFLKKLKKMMIPGKKSNLAKFISELKSIITKMLNNNTITMPGGYEELKREEGEEKALYVVAVGIWKEGIHKGVF